MCASFAYTCSATVSSLLVGAGFAPCSPFGAAVTFYGGLNDVTPAGVTGQCAMFTAFAPLANAMARTQRRSIPFFERRKPCVAPASSALPNCSHCDIRYMGELRIM